MANCYPLLQAVALSGFFMHKITASPRKNRIFQTKSWRKLFFSPLKVMGSSGFFQIRCMNPVLIVFDNILADMGPNKKLSPIVTELFLKGRNLVFFTCFTSKFYF